MLKKALSIILTITICLGIMPVWQNVRAAADNFSTISVGGNHSVAIKSDGSLWTWGENKYCQLGDGTKEDRLTPVKIMDGAVAVSTGRWHNMVIKDDGSLWAWGSNLYGSLGDGTTEDKLAPVKIMDDVTSISAGSHYGMAIKKDGSLWVWGENEYGQLGDGTTENKLDPVKVMDHVITVSAGYSYSMAIKTDGSLWIWGRNYEGRFGDGTTRDSCVPIKIMDDVKSISNGGDHNLAIKNDGSVWAWGRNYDLGLGVFENRTMPVKIMDDVKLALACNHGSMVIKNDGMLWSWGHEILGSIGDGGMDDRSVPVKVMDDVVWAVAGTHSEGHSMAIKSDGSLWAWGWSSHGQVGDGIIDVRYYPVKIMDDIMMPDGITAIATLDTPTYRYNTPKWKYSGTMSTLDRATSKYTAAQTVKEFTRFPRKGEEKNPVRADYSILFAEAAIARIASKTVTGDVTIDRLLLSIELDAKASETHLLVERELSYQYIPNLRKLRSMVTVKCDQSNVVDAVNIKVNKNYSDGEADIVKVEVGFANLYLEKGRVATTDIKLEDMGESKVGVYFSNAAEKSIVTLSIPMLDGMSFEDSKYIAIMDENGSPVGGKYNPTTGFIDAKISESGVYSVVENKKNFDDIADQPWEVQEAIRYLASKGVINGTSETTFSPNETISRAEIAALIIRMLGKYDPDSDGGFGDVTRADWYFGTAGSSKNNDIINGFEDGTFRGAMPISKEQVFAVLARVLRSEMHYNTPDDLGKHLPYVDTDSIADWAKSDIAIASMADLIMQRSDDAFDSGELMTRGNAAIAIKRLYDRIW